MPHAPVLSYTVSVEKMWTQNTCIIHDVWRLLILSNEEKTNDYENFEKGIIYMKILKKGGVVEKRGRRKRNPCPMRLWTTPTCLLCCFMIYRSKNYFALTYILIYSIDCSFST
jgi:hypothetical protein